MSNPLNTNTFNSEEIQIILQSSRDLSNQLSRLIQVLENLLERKASSNLLVGEKKLLSKPVLSKNIPVKIQEQPIQEQSSTSVDFMNLAFVSNLTNLKNYQTNECYKLFNAQSNEHGFISRNCYNHCFRKIIKSGPTDYDFSQKRLIEKLVDSIFESFSTDSLDINVKKLVSGLSCLCGGSREDKVKMCFHLFSKTNDIIEMDLDDLTIYLTSIYTILFLTQKNKPLHIEFGNTPEELANTTVNVIYKELQKNTITLEEFINWYR
jgi:hypothetical protein